MRTMSLRMQAVRATKVFCRRPATLIKSFEDAVVFDGAQRGHVERAAGRGALYMATLCAVKHDRILKAFYQRCGTPAKNLGGPDRLHAQTHRPHEPPP